LTNLMTEGSITRKLLEFAVPMFFCTIFQQLYSVADAIIVGRFAGTTGLAAIGVTSQIILLTVSVGIGFMLGISTVISESIGSGSMDRLRQTEAIAVYIVFITYGIKLVIGLFLARPILELTNTPADVMDGAVTYLRILFCGGLFTYAYSMCVYIMRACGESLKPLLLLAFSSIMNVGLDLLFVCVFDMGVAGAAIGTVIAESAAAGLCLWYMHAKMPQLRISMQDFKALKKPLVAYTMKLSVPSSLQIGAVMFCSILVQAVINKYGTDVVAGYTAAVKIEQLVMAAVSALGGALSTFAAQNRGAGNFDRISLGLRTSVRDSALLTVSLSALIFFFGGQLVSLFAEAGSTAVVGAGYEYLKITCWFYIASALSSLFSSVLRGMADAAAPLIIGTVQIAVNLAAIFILAPILGCEGVWISVAAGWVLCALTGGIRLKRFF